VTFLWPKMLVLLLGVPLLVYGYISLVRLRNRRRQELAAMGFAPNAATRRRRRLQHVPFALLLLAVVLLLVALARPQMTLGLPYRSGTVILAFDVSNSMLADDLKPTRIDAAKAAAHAFVDKQPSSIQIGVVAFSAGGLVTQQPTSNKADVQAAIDRLTPMGATSLGQGIFASLNAIAGKPLAIDPNQLGGNAPSAAGDPDGPTAAPGSSIGYYGSSAIILLSDGENTDNPDPLSVAQLASVAGVKIYPIGIGSPQGAVIKVDGFSVATALDEDELTKIATLTNGTYFNAQDAASLAKVYDHIDLQVTTNPKKTEVTALVSAISIVLLLISAALSLVWFGRLV
jgi:Ca-activated chloride channel family protein